MDNSSLAVEAETTVSVEFPADLYQEIKRIAAEKKWPESKAVILLTRLGAKAQNQAEESLSSSYEAFVNEIDVKRQDQRGDALIRSIFGLTQLPKIRFHQLPLNLLPHMKAHGREID